MKDETKTDIVTIAQPRFICHQCEDEFTSKRIPFDGESFCSQRCVAKYHMSNESTKDSTFRKFRSRKR